MSRKRKHDSTSDSSSQSSESSNESSDESTEPVLKKAKLELSVQNSNQETKNEFDEIEEMYKRWLQNGEMEDDLHSKIEKRADYEAYCNKMGAQLMENVSVSVVYDIFIDQLEYYRGEEIGFDEDGDENEETFDCYMFDVTVNMVKDALTKFFQLSGIFDGDFSTCYQDMQKDLTKKWTKHSLFDSIPGRPLPVLLKRKCLAPSVMNWCDIVINFHSTYILKCFF